MRGRLLNVVFGLWFLGARSLWAAAAEDDPKPMRFPSPDGGPRVVYSLAETGTAGPWKYLGETAKGLEKLSFKVNEKDPDNIGGTQVLEAEVLDPTALGIEFSFKAGDQVYVSTPPAFGEMKRVIRRAYVYWRRFPDGAGLLLLRTELDSPVPGGQGYLLSNKPLPKQSWSQREPNEEDYNLVKKALLAKYPGKLSKGDPQGRGYEIRTVVLTPSHGVFYSGFLGYQSSVNFLIHSQSKKVSVLWSSPDGKVSPVFDLDKDGVPEYAVTYDSAPRCLSKLYPTANESCLGQ